MVDPVAPTPEPADEKPFSLEALAEAFAEVVGAEPSVEEAPDSNEPEGQPAGQPTLATAEQPFQVDLEEDDLVDEADDASEISPETILEAMLFVGDRENQPLSARRAADLMRGVDPTEIPGLIERLNARYSADGRPYWIVEQGTGYRMTLRKKFHGLRNRFYGKTREARLSQAAIDTLAIVAYQRANTADEIAQIRGKPSAAVLAQLVRRGLLRIERTKVDRRQVALYHPTKRFLEVFGLECLDDLPQSEELDRSG